MISNRRGFTLIELLVVVAMIALIMGAISMSIRGASERARIERARSDVKTVAQAILSYENVDQGNETFKLPKMTKAVANADSLGFLLGRKTVKGEKIPATLMAELQGGGTMRDPWGRPYYVTIREGSLDVEGDTTTYSTGYFLPNWYRITEGER